MGPKYNYGSLENPPYYLTAYGIAVKHGYQGTEEEWIHEIQESAHDSSIAAAESAASALQSKGTAEAFGAGTRGGEPLEEDDPAYHNNAQYYSANADTKAAAAADSAEDSEAYAIGKRSGVDVDSDDPAYENNSKYYSDLAKDYAEDTGGLVTTTVTGWLADNVDPETGYVLDRSLASSEAAAPADLVGELKSALGAFETAEGVIKYGNNGSMASSASFPTVKRTGNLLSLDGSYGTSANNTYCIKLTGDLDKTGYPSSANAWGKELALGSGKTYSVRMALISGTISNPSSTFFEIRVVNASGTVVQTVGLNESKSIKWGSGNALLYLAAGRNISCSNAILAIFVIDVSEIAGITSADTNFTLDYLASNAFSVYAADYLVGKGYSGTTGTIIDSVNHIITGFIPVKTGDAVKAFVNGINLIKSRVDGETRKIAFYNTSKTWQSTVTVPTDGFGVDYYPVTADGYVRLMLRKADVNPQVFVTSLLKKERLIDLIVFAGQSNMAGRGETNATYPETAPTVIPGAGYEFKAITDPTKLYPLAEPLGYAENAPDDESGIYDGTKKTGDMGAAFVNAYYSNGGNVPVVCVSASEGGSSSTEWLPTTGNNFIDLSNRLTTARQWLVDNGYSIRHQYCLWCQGESDGDNIANGSETFAEYESRARSIFNGLISLGFEKVLLVRIGNHNSGTSTRYTAIIQWQTTEAQTNDALVMVSCDFAGMRSKGMMKDSFHYYQIGYNITGNSAGINAALYATTGKEPTMYDPENDNLYYSHKN